MVEPPPIARRTWFCAALAVTAVSVLPSCRERSVAISAFSKGMPRGPATTAYFDLVYAALATWLAAEGYVSAEPPDPPMKWSSTYPSQTDHWFYSESEQLRVMTRRPTSEREGLDVYVCLRIQGSDSTVEAAQQRGEIRLRALSAWWGDYQARHPLPKS